MVKNMGFNFPSADIGSTVNLETSRLFYAAGLVIAGIVVDRSRKRGAVLCMAALIMPFALMAIAGEPVPSAVLWAVDYFFYGFFSVFRVILFADLSARSQRMHLSGFGLVFGRVGDALGTMACVSLGGNTVALVTVAAVMFAACVFVFWRLFQQLFVPAAPQQRSERELFDRFAAHHDLSPREREVLQLILDNKTNAEAAAVLVVSESTVKFHVRNLLKKTGCKNRLEVADLYTESREG
jgi:DNA-binding CsgD family transcriptional regulator